MSRIFITGDTHGDIDLEKIEDFPLKNELKKDDYMIIAGDFGGLWSGSKKGIEYGYTKYDGEDIDYSHDENIINYFNNQPYTTLFIDGNHENFDLLNSYPVKTWNGGKVHMISNSIYHLMRGQVFNIGGRKILTIGGGESVDKQIRREGVSYWKEELPTVNDIKEYIKTIKANDCKFDYVITHCCANRFHKYLDLQFNKTDILTDFFESMEDKIKYDCWFFGHYHQDKEIDDKHVCLFNDIIELM
jgi:predicted phosphodiesterase